MDSQNSNTGKQSIIIVTGNAGKAKEFGELLGSSFDVTNKTYDLDETQGNPRDIAQRKAKLASSHFGTAVVIEDTSLYLKELGIYIGPYCKWLGVDDNGKETAERQCRNFNKMAVGCTDKTLIALCIIAYCEPGEEPVLYEGSFEGFCMPFDQGVPKDGSKYFGWDPVMGDPSTGLSFAQMSSEQKNKVSHRGRAVQAFISGMLSKKRSIEKIDNGYLNQQSKKVISFFANEPSDASELVASYFSKKIDVSYVSSNTPVSGSNTPVSGSNTSSLPCDVLMQKSEALANHLNQPVIVEGSFVFPTWCGEAFASSVKGLGMITDEQGTPVLQNGNLQFNRNLLCARLFAITQGVTDDKRLTNVYALAYCEPGKAPVLFRDQQIGIACQPNQGKPNNSDASFCEWEPVFWLGSSSLAQLTAQQKFNLDYRLRVYSKLFEHLKI